jgi:hypothetical protein
MKLVAILIELNDVRRRYYIDDVVELEDEQAEHWIRQGWAETVAPEEVETATLEAGEEQAVKPPARRRGRPRKT